MAEPEVNLEADANPSQLGRRTLFAAVAVSYAASYMPRAWSAGGVPGYDAFIAVSQFLTGHATLDGRLGARAFNALLAKDADFGGEVGRLNALIASEKPDPLTFQASLDRANSPLAALPRKIVKAWYLGVVGDGEQARCIAFENNLTNRAVADHLRPPSYCFGAYGSWVKKPV